MPNKIINSQGEYYKDSFSGPNGTWSLIGTEGDGKVMDCLDTFRNSDNGLYKTLSRKDVYKSAEAGLIN